MNITEARPVVYFYGHSFQCIAMSLTSHAITTKYTLNTGKCLLKTATETELFGALNPVNHKGLYQGWQRKTQQWTITTTITKNWLQNNRYKGKHRRTGGHLRSQFHWVCLTPALHPERTWCSSTCCPSARRSLTARPWMRSTSPGFLLSGWSRLLLPGFSQAHPLEQKNPSVLVWSNKYNVFIHVAYLWLSCTSLTEAVWSP